MSNMKLGSLHPSPSQIQRAASSNQQRVNTLTLVASQNQGFQMSFLKQKKCTICVNIHIIKKQCASNHYKLSTFWLIFSAPWLKTLCLLHSVFIKTFDSFSCTALRNTASASQNKGFANIALCGLALRRSECKAPPRSGRVVWKKLASSHSATKMPAIPHFVAS